MDILFLVVGNQGFVEGILELLALPILLMKQTRELNLMLAKYMR